MDPLPPEAVLALIVPRPIFPPTRRIPPFEMVIEPTPGAALAAAEDAKEVMIIGGEDVFGLFLPQATRIYLTRVDAVVEGDARFPGFDSRAWTLLHSELHAEDERHAHARDLREHQQHQRRDGAPAVAPDGTPQRDDQPLPAWFLRAASAGPGRRGKG